MHFSFHTSFSTLNELQGREGFRTKEERSPTVQIFGSRRGLVVDKGGSPEYFGGNLTVQEGCGMKFNSIFFL